MDRLVPGIELSASSRPHSGCDDARPSTLGAHRVAEMIASVGAVGKHFAGIVGQSIRNGVAVLGVGAVTAISSTRAVSA
ncbi:hypothetical protein [Mesorhizobium sp. M1365]|uniref:hypothetical protein n=1 Tax=Mesorhizobium sp. M1365 TaxID=2957090 RepID=UPI003334C527